jgi:hypothetical protein
MAAIRDRYAGAGTRRARVANFDYSPVCTGISALGPVLLVAPYRRPDDVPAPDLSPRFANDIRGSSVRLCIKVSFNGTFVIWRHVTIFEETGCGECRKKEKLYREELAIAIGAAISGH